MCRMTSVLFCKIHCMECRLVSHGDHSCVIRPARFSAKMDTNSVLNHRYSIHALRMGNGDRGPKMLIHFVIHSAPSMFPASLPRHPELLLIVVLGAVQNVTFSFSSTSHRLEARFIREHKTNTTPNTMDHHNIHSVPGGLCKKTL